MSSTTSSSSCSVQKKIFRRCQSFWESLQVDNHGSLRPPQLFARPQDIFQSQHCSNGLPSGFKSDPNRLDRLQHSKPHNGFSQNETSFSQNSTQRGLDQRIRLYLPPQCFPHRPGTQNQVIENKGRLLRIRPNHNSLPDSGGAWSPVHLRSSTNNWQILIQHHRLLFRFFSGPNYRFSHLYLSVHDFSYLPLRG